MAYVIIPSTLWKINNILTDLYKYSDKNQQILLKNDWFLMIVAEIYQKFLPNIQTLHLKLFTKLHDLSCKNTKFSSFSGGAHPPQTPHCAPKRAIGTDAPPNYPPTDIFISKFPIKKQTFHKSAEVVLGVVNSRLTSTRQQLRVGYCALCCATRVALAWLWMILATQTRNLIAMVHAPE